MQNDASILPCTMQRTHPSGLEMQLCVKQYSRDGPCRLYRFDLSQTLEYGIHPLNLQFRLRCVNFLAFVFPGSKAILEANNQQLYRITFRQLGDQDIPTGPDFGSSADGTKFCGVLIPFRDACPHTTVGLKHATAPRLRELSGYDGLGRDFLNCFEHPTRPQNSSELAFPIEQIERVANIWKIQLFVNRNVFANWIYWDRPRLFGAVKGVVGPISNYKKIL
jgi:hypothetical protein